MNSDTEIRISEITYRTNFAGQQLQDAVDAMDDEERRQYYQELNDVSRRIGEAVTRSVDARFEQMMLGQSFLPPDPTHYTQDTTATIVDV